MAALNSIGYAYNAEDSTPYSPIEEKTWIEWWNNNTKQQLTDWQRKLDGKGKLVGGHVIYKGQVGIVPMSDQCNGHHGKLIEILPEQFVSLWNVPCYYKDPDNKSAKPKRIANCYPELLGKNWKLVNLSCTLSIGLMFGITPDDVTQTIQLEKKYANEE